MAPRGIASLFVVVFLVLFARPLEAQPEAQTGYLRVTVATTGPISDGMFYIVRYGSFYADQFGVPPNGSRTVRFGNMLGPRTVPLTLENVPENCTLRGRNPQEALVVPDETVEVTFAVECDLALPEGRDIQRDAQRDSRRERDEVTVPVERQLLRAQEADQLEVAPALETTLVEELAIEAISGYWDSSPDNRSEVPQFFGTEPPGKVIARLRVPAGSFVFFSKLDVRLLTDQHGYVGCRLVAGPDADESSVVWYDPPLRTWFGFFISLNVVHTFALPGEVLLQCYGSGPFSGGGADHIKITAIKVGKLTNRPLEIVN